MRAFRHASRRSSLRRPTLWRLTLIQGVVLLITGLASTLFWPAHAVSIWWAGLVAVCAQAFWIWRTLRGFGDPGSEAFVAGAATGLIGKWVIILVGLVLLWSNLPDVSAAATIVTVFGLNTLAALTAPILISRSR